MIAGGVAGAMLNVFDVKTFGISMPGLISLAGYADPNNSLNMVIAILGSGLAFVAALALVLILGFTEENTEAETIVETGKQIQLAAPVTGTIVPIEIVSDSMFADQIMGYTAAIMPSNHTISSPFNGEVVMIAETSHAIGLKSDEGVEVLLHLGIDTVELQGAGFALQVKVGDSVRTGEPLMTMDVPAIQMAGYDPVVLMIVTNTKDYLKILPTTETDEVTAKTVIAVAVN